MKSLPTSHASALALVAARNVAIMKCRDMRPYQEKLREVQRNAEEALRLATQNYDEQSNKIGAVLAEISQHAEAYRTLTGLEIPPSPVNEY